MDLNDELAAHLHDSVVSGRVAQKLIRAFESLDVSPNQRRYILNKLIKPLIRQANKQYGEGLDFGKMMGDLWQEDESNEGYYY